MVVFTCNACGDSLKKNQVEKHYMTVCRKCEVLSCVDCGKDFWGEEYQTHTKCISEEEKYSGKNYTPKPNANKGEVKQMQWTQQVQDAIDKSKSHPKLRNVLERMKEYPNIPRKRAKFENFVRNSLNTRDNSLITQVWDLLLANASQNSQSNDKNSENGKVNESNKTDSSVKQVENGDISNGNRCEIENNIEENGKQLSKREKKEKRQKKSHKKEKKDKQSHMENGESCVEIEEDGKKTKKKKRKRQEEEEQCEEEDCSSKKKKLKHNEDEECDSLNQSTTDEMEQSEEQNKDKVRFSWEDVITNVLRSKGEISLKRLRKKVVAEYISLGCRVKTEEKLWAKFNQKVNKNPTFLVLKDRVKLKER